MTVNIARDPRQVFDDHLGVLTRYATRAVVNGDCLADLEEHDKSVRMREFLAVGSIFNLTERELVGLLLKESLRPRRRCGCPTCKAREGRQSNPAA